MEMPQVISQTDTRQKRRSFADLRFDILEQLCNDRNTVNGIAKSTSINWKTVDNHLIYLIGRGYAEKVFDSEFVKIFSITEQGQEVLVRRKKKAENTQKKLHAAKVKQERLASRRLALQKKK